MLLSNLMSAQQALDEDKYREFISAMHHSMLLQLQSEIKSDLYEFAWFNSDLENMVPNETATQRMWHDAIRWKCSLLANIEDRTLALSRIREKVDAALLQYDGIEKEIGNALQTVGKQVSPNARRSLLTHQYTPFNIEQRHQGLVSCLQKDSLLVRLAQNVMQFEQYTTESSQFNEETRERLKKLLTDARDALKELTAAQANQVQLSSQLEMVEETRLQLDLNLPRLQQEMKELDRKFSQLLTEFGRNVTPILSSATASVLTTSGVYVAVLGELEGLAHTSWKVMDRHQIAAGQQILNCKKARDFIREHLHSTNELIAMVQTRLHNVLRLPSSIGPGSKIAEEPALPISTDDFRSIQRDVVNQETIDRVSRANSQIFDQLSPPDVVCGLSSTTEEPCLESGSGLATSSNSSNTFAVNVLSMVRAKLEGRIAVVDASMLPPKSSPPPITAQVNRPLSINAHVQTLFQQATSLDNLCKMYEGWQAWV